MKTISEVRREGFEALEKTLGPRDMERFIRSFGTGYGDYTKERHQWLPEKLDDIKEDLMKFQKKRKAKKES
jgi:hypothetical protein